MGRIILYTHAKNWEDPYGRFGVKCKEVKKHLFGHLSPYNPVLRIFSEKQSCSINAPYCHLHSCKKLGRTLEQFWSRGLKHRLV